MRSKSAIKEYLFIIREMVSDVEELIEDRADEDACVEWKSRALGILKRILGSEHAYVKEFDSIKLTTDFFDDFDDLVREQTLTIAMDDAHSFLVALMDELESEHSSTPGMMDMESMFAEMNRYVVSHVGDPMTRSTLHNRITRLREGMMTGEISGDEARHHIEHIGYLDAGLYERLV
ncbi:MAG TPA: hypothetical protein PLT69_11555, partial [Deltaproteobacteria bacterium]|nr:hypothetical protein [Deltaproteobacteria bacterium]